MNKDLFFISNWKMNLPCDEELSFASNNYDSFVQLSKKENTHIVLCPSFVSLYTLVKVFKDTKVKIGAQDCSKHNKGSFTSQVCAQSLHQLGCTHCIIGHSETRKENKYDTQDVIEKFKQVINYKMCPIICMGENIKEKELELFFNIIEKQYIIIPPYIKVFIAYEPSWAIGTGKIPELDHLENIFAYLQEKTQKLHPEINWKLLYGGSVQAKNIQKLKKIRYLDGFLIGGASLDIKELEKIVQC